MSLGWSIVVVRVCEVLDEVEFAIVEVEEVVAAAVQVFMRWWVGSEEEDKCIICWCHVAFLL